MTRSVLVVDDSTSVRKMIEFALKARGYTATSAEDGQVALENLEREAFDLVILDINMPRLDGLSLLKIIRESPEWKDTPVMMLTTEGQAADRDQAMALGATAYIVKPFKPTELLAQVAELVTDTAG